MHLAAPALERLGFESVGIALTIGDTPRLGLAGLLSLDLHGMDHERGEDVRDGCGPQLDQQSLRANVDPIPCLWVISGFPFLVS